MKRDTFLDLFFGLGYKEGRLPGLGSQAWVIKGRLPGLGSQAWVIKGDIFLDLDFGLGYKGKMGKETPSWTWISVWVIKEDASWTWISAWVIKGNTFLDLDFGMGYKGGRLPIPGFWLGYKDKSGRGVFKPV
ncbi:unnamed protein product [Rhizophagus irregularis]|nr:unnamed protein product [Rhizophagus irregularis]